MAGEAAALLLVVVVGVLAPLGLYVLVRREHERPTMDRADAERAARADTRADERRGTDDDRP